MKTTGKRKFKKLGILLCALLTAVIIGCQAVGGLDLNEMILKQIEVGQQEMSQKLEVEVAFKEDMWEEAVNDPEASPEMIRFVESFKKTTFEITHAKTDADGNYWMTGVFGFGKGSIPFTFHSDGKAIRLDLDGAKQPFVVDLAALAGDSDEAAQEEALRKPLMEQVRKLTRTVATYFVNNLPNPQVLTVDRVNEQVHGVSTDLFKVHAELNGEQLGQLVAVYVDNLVKDQDGLRDTLKKFAQWISELPPELTAYMEDSGFGGEDFDIDAFVEDGMDTLFPLLESLQSEITSAQEADEWGEIFDKGIMLTTDLYVDSALHLRKSAMELKIAPAFFSTEDSPISQITIRSQSETWNVNGDVEVPPVQVPWNAVMDDELDSMQPYRAIRMFDESSILYDVLKNDLAIDDQSFELSNVWGIPFYTDASGVAYIPLRPAMDEFGAKVYYNSRTGEIRFYDEPTDQGFSFRLGSNEAVVNGKTVKLAHKLENHGYYTYIAADDLLNLLHAEYDLLELDEGIMIMQITRDL